MERPTFAIGLGATALGVAAFAALAANGSLRSPQAAATETAPHEFLAIGFAFVLLTGGVVATLLAYVDRGLGEPT